MQKAHPGASTSVKLRAGKTHLGIQAKMVDDGDGVSWNLGRKNFLG